MKLTKDFLTTLIKHEISEMGPVGQDAGFSPTVPFPGPAIAIAAGPEAGPEEEVDSILADLQQLLDAWTERDPNTPAGMYYHELSSVFDKYGGGGCGGPPME